MIPVRVLEAEFVATAVTPESYPTPWRPEVVFVGRSNVGKSSMINALTGRKKLVRVSNTPGRTRTLNFFQVTVEYRSKKHVMRLADVPGYGFAKASKTERIQWEKMIQTYLEGRKDIEVVVSIVDAEVGPTDDDHGMIEYLQQIDRRILVAATKVDRIIKAKRKPRLSELARELNVPEEVVVPFSATDGIGHDELWSTILSAIGKAAPK